MQRILLVVAAAFAMAVAVSCSKSPAEMLQSAWKIKEMTINGKPAKEAQREQMMQFVQMRMMMDSTMSDSAKQAMVAQIDRDIATQDSIMRTVVWTFNDGGNFSMATPDTTLTGTYTLSEDAKKLTITLPGQNAAEFNVSPISSDRLELNMGEGEQMQTTIFEPAGN